MLLLKLWPNHPLVLYTLCSLLTSTAKTGRLGLCGNLGSDVTKVIASLRTMTMRRSSKTTLPPHLPLSWNQRAASLPQLQYPPGETSCMTLLSTSTISIWQLAPMSQILPWTMTPTKALQHLALSPLTKHNRMALSDITPDRMAQRTVPTHSDCLSALRMTLAVPLASR